MKRVLLRVVSIRAMDKIQIKTCLTHVVIWNLVRFIREVQEPSVIIPS